MLGEGKQHLIKYILNRTSEEGKTTRSIQKETTLGDGYTNGPVCLPAELHMYAMDIPLRCCPMIKLYVDITPLWFFLI